LPKISSGYHTLIPPDEYVNSPDHIGRGTPTKSTSTPDLKSIFSHQFDQESVNVISIHGLNRGHRSSTITHSTTQFADSNRSISPPPRKMMETGMLKNTSNNMGSNRVDQFNGNGIDEMELINRMNRLELKTTKLEQHLKRLRYHANS